MPPASDHHTADRRASSAQQARTRQSPCGVSAGEGGRQAGLAPEPWVQVPQRLVKGHLVATEPVSFRLRCGVHTPGLGVGSMADGGLLAGGTRDEGDHSPPGPPRGHPAHSAPAG